MEELKDDALVAAAVDLLRGNTHLACDAPIATHDGIYDTRGKGGEPRNSKPAEQPNPMALQVQRS